MLECKIEKGKLNARGEGKTLELLAEASIIALDVIGRCSKDEASFLHNKNIVVHLIAKMKYEDFDGSKGAKKNTRAER